MKDLSGNISPSDKAFYISLISTIPLPPSTGLKWSDVYFVHLRGEKEETFDDLTAEYFHLAPSSNLQTFSEKILNTELCFLHIFCGCANGNDEDPYRVTFRTRSYYARPITFWLSPVGFLLFPYEKKEAWEDIIRQRLSTIKGWLWEMFLSQVERYFSADVLVQCSISTMVEQMAFQAAQCLTPLSWQVDQESEKSYAPALFTPGGEKLSLSLRSEHRLNYHMPPILPYVALADFSWEYRDSSLKERKTDLAVKLENLINRQYKRFEDLRLVTAQQYSIPSIKKQMEVIKGNIIEIQTQLEEIESIVRRKLDGKALEAPEFCFYPDSPKSFKIRFEGKDIPAMTKKPSRLFHLLLSHPNVSMDMYKIYAMIDQKFEREDEAKELKEREKRRRIRDYIKNDLITLKVLEEAADHNEVYRYRKRLTEGIRLLELSIQHFPDLYLEEYLENYKLFQQKYIEDDIHEGFRQQSESFLSPSENILSKKTARERLTTPIRNFYKTLKNNGYKRFAQYLKETIKREEINGVHYYTFLPDASSKESWRNIQWKLKA